MENYEEKYNKALEVIDTIKKSNEDNAKLVEFIEYNYPELAESEDERIRKALISYFIDFHLPTFQNLNPKDIVFWLEKQRELKEKPTKKQVWDYCDKLSSEWWQMTMNKWGTLTDEEKSKYNQFIGFNDFSDMLMNITAGALFQLIDTGKLEYEEGSLLLEKPDDTPKPLEVVNPINKKQCEQKPVEESWPNLSNCLHDCKNCTGRCIYRKEEYQNQKPDKVEPKFKVGDWVVHDMSDGRKVIGQIINMTNKSYILDNKDFNTFYFNDLENDYRLWTIQDAKDGDVLVFDDIIMIFKNIKTVCTANTYILYCDKIVIDDWCDFGNNAQPATKEQRDLLFQKMKEAGYEWDAYKKELKKIEQNTAWSEEDERIRKEILRHFEEHRSAVPTQAVLDEWISWLEKRGEQDNNEDSNILQRFSFYSYKDEPNVLYLSGLYVNEECRNKGIGTKILEVADEAAKSLNCHTIRLKTESGSDAERLYKENGYNTLKKEGNQVWLEKHGENKSVEIPALVCPKCMKSFDTCKDHPSYHNRINYICPHCGYDGDSTDFETSYERHPIHSVN